MACVLTPQCGFWYSYFWCQLPKNTMDMDMTVRTMKGSLSFKRDCFTLIISCNLWIPDHHPYPSLAEKMMTYLEWKEHVADSRHPSPNYPEKPKSQCQRKHRMAQRKQRREPSLVKAGSSSKYK